MSLTYKAYLSPPFFFHFVALNWNWYPLWNCIIFFYSSLAYVWSCPLVMAALLCSDCLPWLLPQWPPIPNLSSSAVQTPPPTTTLAIFWHGRVKSHDFFYYYYYFFIFYIYFIYFFKSRKTKWCENKNKMKIEIKKDKIK